MKCFSCNITSKKEISRARINPKLKSLAIKEYETNLFSPDFLEKASKRIEVAK